MPLHDPVAPMLVVATNAMFRDPALADLSDADLDEYRKSRDLAAIRDRLRGEPTIFVVQRLSAPYAITLDSIVGALRPLTAVAASCHEVRLPDGAVLKPDHKKMRAGAHGTKTADVEEWIGELVDRFGVETVYEIGRVAHEWARLPRSAVGPFTY